jgi:hypothetical protein
VWQARHIVRNAERAQRAAAALMHYRNPDGTPALWEDFLADFMHLAHREDADFQKLLREANMHFTAEMNGEP